MILAKRRQLFEFCDQAWLTGWMREAYVDCLDVVIKFGGQYNRMHIPFAEWSLKLEASSVVDIASGGAGPVETIISHAQRDKLSLPRIILSDLFPNIERYQAIKEKFGADKVDYCDTSFDANDSDSFPGVPRMICSALHHFEEDQVRQLFYHSLKSGGGIFVLEPLTRTIFSILGCIIGAPLFAILTPFFCDRFSWRKTLVTSIFPLVPLMVAFDGIVSSLRSYTLEEIKELMPKDLPGVLHCDGGRCSLTGGLYFYALIVNKQSE